MRPPRRPNARTALTALAVVVLLAAILVISSSEDDPDLSNVELAPLHLLDDGAGQRHFEVSYPGGAPRATVIYIHGGGWRSHSQATFSRARPQIDELTAAGFRVVAISTDESPALATLRAKVKPDRVLDDVLAFHDQVADAFPAQPICAHGISGGGHLALMLAIERPGLACASAIGPPTDLNAFLRDARLGRDPRARCRRSASPVNAGYQIGACIAIATWGDSEQDLDLASPALRWPTSLETPVWAGFEEDDPVVPESQRNALADAVPNAEIEVLENDPEGPVFAHSGVREDELERADAAWISWLDRVVPPVEGAVEVPDGDLVRGEHAACNSRLAAGPSWRLGRRRDRAELLDAAGRWLPQTRSTALSATNSCDGREDLQESGLSLSALGLGEEEAAFVERGESADWVFEAPEGSVIESMTASFRGFVANPGVWRIGLYSRASESEDWQPVAECDGESCEGLDLQRVASGATIVPAGTRAGAEKLKSLPDQTWSLDGGPVSLKWSLECVAPRGCLPRSINDGADPEAADPVRAVDPTGRPAVLSLYGLVVETAED